MLKAFARRLRSFATRDITNELAEIKADLRTFTDALRYVMESGDEEHQSLGRIDGSIAKLDQRLETIDGSIAKLDQRLESIYGATDQTRHLTIVNLKLLKMQTLGAEPIVSCAYNGTIPIKFFVPKAATDYIQGYHLFYENFWEVELLDQLKGFAKGKAILDIGANVGNHVIYWSRVAGAKSIKAFEPIPELFGILKRNMELNGIHNAEAFDLALGRERSFGRSVSKGENRMQSEIFASQDDAAGINIVPLDELDIAEADFAKIDVEGHTLDLLHGATRTLSRLKPAIFVELFAIERDACHQILEGIGYRLVKSLVDSNYLYVHKDRPFAGELDFA
ncbi:FkbM family methyltransferase [Cupriavidus necator]|uniref:FkbM family methyltransferase n=1 Tax=Cupriavidus necator TaxID=106590 RepID=A0A1U9UQP9_CUPNE|nr:FkbM family methyltransferase [Cupriavidus necator]AQV94475.1 FkbM family methyltransferase [Cupriavidus necator]